MAVKRRRTDTHRQLFFMGCELQLANQILIGKVIEDGTSAQSSFRTGKGDLWDHLAFRAVILLEHW